MCICLPFLLLDIALFIIRLSRTPADCCIVHQETTYIILSPYLMYDAVDFFPTFDHSFYLKKIYVIIIYFIVT